MPEIRSTDDEELIFFAVLFMLNILCDVIHDVIDKHVHFWRIGWWAIGQLRKWLASVIAGKGRRTEQYL